MATMSREDAEAFLADVHVGVFAIEHRGHGPLAVPVWYLFEDGEVRIHTDSTTLKAKLIGPDSRATLVAQTEAPPYKYVSVEGPVRVEQRRDADPQMAIRYLGEQGGRAYAAQSASENGVVITITPQRWRSADYSS